MQRAAFLVREARSRAGLSVRELASRADVAASTVSRVERDSMDPTIGMLSRLLAAAGADLELRSRPAPRLGDLVDAWKARSERDRIDWTRLRATIDQLNRHSDLVRPAIEIRPEPSGSDLLDNLLAAVAEKLSDEAGIARPIWTGEIEPLAEPWVIPGTPQMQAAAWATTPPQFSARGMTLAVNGLWREPEAVRAS